MNKINIIIVLLLLVSCKKEKDIFNYTINYKNPYPENNATDISLRGNIIQFAEIEETGLAEYTKEYKIYFDTLNPPVKLLNSSIEKQLSIGLSVLKPNKTYYWAFTSLIPYMEDWSDIQSFKTSTFNGNWKLESIADKRGLLANYSNNSAEDFDWMKWYNWTDKSYKSYVEIINGIEFVSYIEYTVNKDSLLNVEAEIEEINFSNHVIKLIKNNNFQRISFVYDSNKGSLQINDLINSNEYNFPAVNIGYIPYYEKAVLLLINKKGIMFIFTRA